MDERRRERNWSMQVTALYDYEPEQLDELGFREGDVLRVLRVQDDGWWSGYNVGTPNAVGLFPSNYVQAQRSVAPLQSTKKTLVDAVTTPRPPASSRQRIQQEARQAPDTPELEDEEEEEDDEVQELRGGFRGHIGTVLQLRKNLEESERATNAVRDARRQAERDKLRRTKGWRERGQNEEDEEEQLAQHESVTDRRRQQQENASDNEEDTDDDDDESAYPQQQGQMHDGSEQGAEDAELEKSSADEGENNTHKAAEAEQAEMAIEAENAAATVIARSYRRHRAVVQEQHERQRRDEQRKLSEVAAVYIQRWAAHAYSRQRRRRQRELEQSTARRRWERENQAATDIQKWIRMRWSCFWRRRVQLERERRNEMALQHKELEDAKRWQAEEDQKRVEEEENEHDRVLQQTLEEEEEKEQRRQLELKAAENEVQRRFEEAGEQEDEGDQHDVEPAVPSPSAQSRSPYKPRRKVMKREAVELIKTLVQQQLGETLRDHDAKMDELQRMVARLQTVVRKQTAMLEDSTDQIVNLQMGQEHERKIPMPQKSNGAGNSPFLPRIGVQSTVPRQPIAPSGLRAPRPVVLSKLPVLAGSTKGAHSNQSKRM